MRAVGSFSQTNHGDAADIRGKPNSYGNSRGGKAVVGWLFMLTVKEMKAQSVIFCPRSQS